jgi:Notch-like protein
MICPAYKICSEQPTGPVCICAGNKAGTLCQYGKSNESIIYFFRFYLDNPCISSKFHCQNGGTCISSETDPPISSCLCREGYTGTYCENSKENNPCSSNPCQTRGYCVLSTSNRTYTCICQDHFLGEQCERTNPCMSSPCLNHGICQANWNQTDTWLSCRCLGTFTGNRCETSMLNPCGGLCMNG